MRAPVPALSAAVLVVALLTACTATGAPAGSGATSGSSVSGGAPTASAPGTATAPPAALPTVEVLPSADVAVEGAPGAVVSAFGSVWVMSHRSTILRRVDPEKLRVTGTVDTGVLGCGDITAAAGSVWVTGCSATLGLVRVDPRSLRVVSTRVELNGLGPAFHAGELWMAAGSEGTVGLRRADPARLAAAQAVPVVGLGEDVGVVEAAGSVWVADRSAVVYRIDPKAGSVLAAVPLPLDETGGSYLIAHDGAPWYLDGGLGAVARVDPATNSPAVLSVRPVRPPEYRGVAASSAPGRAGRLWVRSGSDEAWLVDTRQDKVIRRVAIADGGGGDLQEVDGSLWVAHFGLDTVQRIRLG